MSASVAIVGAGPSGCFVAQALLKAAPDLRLDLIDALPVPYGLVRYGVAADHQGTKAVIRQFERLFERQGAGFVGNLAVGRDLPLERLRACYDVVVLAAGLAGDRRLGIPGDDLAGIAGSGAVTRALNDHPDAGPLPELGPDVVIVGNGNVALDLLRLLVKTPEDLAGSDLGPVASRWLAESGVKRITVLGRSPAAAARFDPAMIRELGRAGGACFRVEAAGSAGDPQGQKVIEALAEIDGAGSGARRVTFRFGCTPVAVEGQGRVRALRVREAGGAIVDLPCDLLLTAIGFEDDGTLGRAALLAGAAEPEAGVLAPGLYATGWFRRGPRGTIPENRADAQALAARILADLPSLPGGKPGRAGLPEGGARIDHAGWQRIDAAERANCPPDRCRVKIATRAEMLALASGTGAEGSKETTS